MLDEFTLGLGQKSAIARSKIGLCQRRSSVNDCLGAIELFALLPCS